MFHLFNRKKGRYTETKPNKERKVISYEDVPLDDYEQERTDINPKTVKKIIIAAAILLAAGLAVLAFANRDKLTPENLGLWWSYEVLGNGGHGYPAEIIGSEVKPGNFAVNQSRVAYASDTSFVTLNSSGKEIANVQLRYSKPVMKSAENRFMTYGLGDTSYQILDYEKELYSGSIDGAIYTGDIASNGHYVLVTEGNGLTRTITEYLNILFQNITSTPSRSTVTAADASPAASQATTAVCGQASMCSTLARRSL